MPGNVRVSGVWREIAQPYVRVAGAWREVAQAWTRVSGVWREWFTAKKERILLVYPNSPNATVYDWNNGFATRYSNPTTAISNYGFSGDFNRTGDALAFSIWGNFPSPQGYSWVNGWGTKWTDAVGSINVNNPARLKFNPAYNSVLFATQERTLGAFKYTSNAWGTKYSLAANVTSGNTFSATWSGNGNVAFSSGAPGAGLIPFDGWLWSDATGFGTRFYLPFGINSTSRGGAGSPNSDRYVVTFDSSPYAITVGWSGTTFNNYAALPSGSGISSVVWNAAWHPAQTAVALAFNNSPWIVAYSYTTTWGTRYANPAVLPSIISTDEAQGISWSATGSHIVLGHQQRSTAAVSSWVWNNGFGTKMADPATPWPTQRVTEVRFTN